jgi:hypothetical protein
MKQNGVNSQNLISSCNYCFFLQYQKKNPTLFYSFSSYLIYYLCGFLLLQKKKMFIQRENTEQQLFNSQKEYRMKRLHSLNIWLYFVSKWISCWYLCVCSDVFNCDGYIFSFSYDVTTIIYVLHNGARVFRMTLAMI